MESDELTAPTPGAAVDESNNVSNEQQADALRRRIAARKKRGQPVDRLEQRLKDLLDGNGRVSESRRNDRRSREPAPHPSRLAAIERAEPIGFPDSLPISEHLDAIRRALQDHQVVVVAGETGSGKTTQLPKLCLALGRGRSRRIAHTQPRRLAARSVAGRIAEELGSELGGLAGYSVRFSEQLSDASAIKLMTDGMLLAETASDRWLNAYDTIILDEAHERSLNVDFLLGYLKRVLQRRRDLKVIVTSATIDVEAFSQHFDNAPIVKVPGRTYPVEVVYRPPEAERDDSDDTPRNEALLESIEALESGAYGSSRARDMLVFLPGEREIMDCARLLRRRRPDLDVLPLYARLPAREQARVFQQSSSRRVVLATNVAETSITVPNIGYVIDTGLARVARYSLRSRLQRLPLEPIAQANAQQRSGRCGRVAPGVCVRLYAEDDFERRRPYLEPEIQRSNLAAVVLQMYALGLGDIGSFPFMDPPDGRAVRDAQRLLFELGALSDPASGRLTRIGRSLARLPVDPSLARMLLEGERLGVLEDVLVVVSALAVQDPRERPPEKAAAADAAHAGFVDDRSDFLGSLRLWRWYAEQREQLTSSRFRRACSKQFLSFVRLREWRDLHRQLLLICKELKWTVRQSELVEEDRVNRVHQALLTGLLRNVGHLHEKREYRGVRGVAFLPFPGSGLGKRTPKWVMAAEIVETRRIYARMLAPLQVEWIERAADHLVRRSWSNPQWSQRRGEVRASERVSLGALVLVENRRVSYTRRDPVRARELMLRDGLVAGAFETRGGFLEHNLQLVQEVSDEEERLRRRDLLVSPDDLFDFYDRCVPADLADARSFERWRKDIEQEHPRLLFMTPEIVRQSSDRSDRDDFPGSVVLDGVEFELKYRFAPGESDDGVSLQCPVGLLPQLRSHQLDWLVPGLLEPLIEAMLRSLPKSERRTLVPIQDHVGPLAQALRPRAVSRSGLLAVELAEVLSQRTGRQFDPASFDAEQAEARLHMNVQVRDESDALMGESRAVAELQQEFRSRLAGMHERRRERRERRELTEWPDEGVPERTVVQDDHGADLVAWPALRDDGTAVSRILLTDPAEARAVHRRGCQRLLLIGCGRIARQTARRLPNIQRSEVLFAAVPHSGTLADALIRAAADDLAELGPDPLRDEVRWEQAQARVRSGLERRAGELALWALEVLEARQRLMLAIEELRADAVAPMAMDLRSWCERVVGGDFVEYTPDNWRDRLPVWIEAAILRVAHVRGAVARDTASMKSVQRWEALWQRVPGDSREDLEVVNFRCLIDELRVALFAQQLGTREPVSDRRLERKWDPLRRRLGLP